MSLFCCLKLVKMRFGGSGNFLKCFFSIFMNPHSLRSSNEKSVSYKLVQKSSKVPLIPKTTFVELPSSTYPQHTCQAFTEVLFRNVVLKDLPPPPHFGWHFCWWCSTALCIQPLPFCFTSVTVYTVSYLQMLWNERMSSSAEHFKLLVWPVLSKNDAL